MPSSRPRKPIPRSPIIARGCATPAPFARTSSATRSRSCCIEKSVAGRAAWTRLFDETIADLRFPFRGRELTEPEALDLLSDRDPEMRREAAE